MKKFFVLVLAIVATACAAPTPTTNRADTNRNASDVAETAAAMTETEAVAKEKQLWETLVRKDYNAFGEMMDEQAIYVTNEGVYDKAGTVRQVDGFMPQDLAFSDWKFLSIDNNTALVTYKATFNAAPEGQTATPYSQYASTAWVNRNGRWLAIYHQDTEIVKETPPPAPQTNLSPSPGATGTPGATSSDVEANEKLVWNALRARNYDAFASYLAPEQIEVERFGVNDKAASVKGVQSFDFSKSELSEWKTLRLSDNAALVTYTARFPGIDPERERHTTIWANRDGKWLAMFHQGTQIKPTQAAPSPSR